MKQLKKQSLSDQRLKLLMELTAEINSNLELDSLLLDIIKAAKILTNSEASSLFLLDKETEELVLTIPTGPATDTVSGKRIPKDKGLAGAILNTKDSVIVNDAEKDPRFLGDFNPNEFKTRNLMGVPLLNRSKEAIGVLEAINKSNKKDFDEEELTIFQMLANQAAIAIEKAQLHEIQYKKELLEQKLELARSIQSGFWPKSAPDLKDYDIAGTSKPATQVGGDYYDYINSELPDTYGFTVADVTGKGMAASLLMASVRSALRTQIENAHSIEKTIKLVNRSIYKDTPIDKFITLFYGDLNYVNHTFTYVNAGHNESYLIDFNKKEIKTLTKGGVMLGIVEEVDFAAETINIEPGQQIVMYTDGITEAQNQKEEFYGEERFEQWLLSHPDNTAAEIVDMLLEEIRNFSNPGPQTDDITVVVIKRNKE